MKIIKNCRNFSEVLKGNVFEQGGLFYIKLNNFDAYDLQHQTIIPFESNEKVIPHISKLIIY